MKLYNIDGFGWIISIFAIETLMLFMACITILCFNLTHFSWYIFILVLISSQSTQLISNSSPQGYTRATCSMDRSSFTEKIKTESTARYSSLLTCKCRFLSAISTFQWRYTWENPPIRRYGAISGACIIYQNRQNLVYFKNFLALACPAVNYYVSSFFIWLWAGIYMLPCPFHYFSAWIEA